MSMFGIFDGIANQICNYLPDASGISIQKAWYGLVNFINQLQRTFADLVFHCQLQVMEQGERIIRL